MAPSGESLTKWVVYSCLHVTGGHRAGFVASAVSTTVMLRQSCQRHKMVARREYVDRWPILPATVNKSGLRVRKHSSNQKAHRNRPVWPTTGINGPVTVERTCPHSDCSGRSHRYAVGIVCNNIRGRETAAGVSQASAGVMQPRRWPNKTIRPSLCCFMMKYYCRPPSCITGTAVQLCFVH